MERPIQKSVIDIDVSCFDTCKAVQKFKNLFFLKNDKIDLVKLIFYNDSNSFEKIENKIIPYFVSKMLLEGTEKYSYKQISEIIDFYGIYLNSSYGKGTSQVSLLLMQQNFSDVFDIFHEVLCCPKFSTDRLEHIKNIDLQNLEVENSSNKTLIGKEFLKLIFGEKNLYGYFRNVEDIKKITVDELNNYYENFYCKNWKCIVTGNINGEMLDQLSDRFQNILIPNITSNFLKIENFEPRKKILEKDSQQEYLCIGKICIPAYHENYKLLWCCVMFLGGYFGSRLMMNIREKGGYTYGIRASLNPLKNCSYFCIKSSVKKNCSEKILAAVKNEIELLQREYVPQEKLYSFKQFFIGEMMTEISNPFVPAAQFQSLDVNNLEKNFYSSLAKTIIDLSPEQILVMAKKYLDFDSMSLVILK
ncbi:MAG: insulinase family protein [Cytophagales bacterium]|jgi:predicted Zn-dependent peptidase|nr:insulinase family protein [Cytophagales bacterium]